MPLVKKVDPDWAPAENPTLEVGEEIMIDDAETLLRDGTVELVEERKPAKKTTKKDDK